MKQSVIKFISLFQINRMMADVTKMSATGCIIINKLTIAINVASSNRPLQALARLSLIC